MEKRRHQAALFSFFNYVQTKTPPGWAAFQKHIADSD
jgi:hypothetical protein